MMANAITSIDKILEFLIVGFLLLDIFRSGPCSATPQYPGNRTSTNRAFFVQPVADIIENHTVPNETESTQLVLPEGYNRLTIPIGSTGYPVYLYVALFIRTILEVDEINEEIVLDADLSLRWSDWKIYEYMEKVTNWTDPETGLPVGNRTLDSDALKLIWKPDIFIDEMESVDRASLLAKLIELNFLSKTRVKDSGDIIYNARITLKLRCSMSFVYYPADTQVCEYHLRSYSYTEDKLRLYWKKWPIPIYLEDPYNANFDLQIDNVEPFVKYEALFIEEKFDYYRRGNYSTLQFAIKARRNLSYHLVQTYLPSILLILITWLCFLIPSNMVEVRIGISMTTVLTLTAMFSSVRQQSPKVSYPMAIDIWMVFNIFIVFVALFLFALIYWMKLRLQKQQKILNETPDPECLDSDLSAIETYQMVVEYTKRHAFYTFAVAFLCFLVIYWSWFLSSSGYFSWSPMTSYNTEGQNRAGFDDFPWDKGMYILHSKEKGLNETDDDPFANLNPTE